MGACHGDSGALDVTVIDASEAVGKVAGLCRAGGPIGNRVAVAGPLHQSRNLALIEGGASCRVRNDFGTPGACSSA